ncbi:MAG: phosphoribosyl-AMP cyclohydrolase [Gammaproteobacteria bacterium]|nr:phosphoribosyl-AMP cyclohydrolase [Gammaproteobacteria bacterium]MDH3856869.1 phosphoribosyl-AMP cyclohydrolase [Gammaproteobacteria bacterium]
MTDWLEQLKWNSDGLVPAIAQDYQSGEVLMMAWMNREALQLSSEQGRAVYWSRSRQKLWFKGESSGHVQQLREIRVDCDADVVLLQVEQIGGIACHTGRRRCFFRVLKDGEWEIDEEIIKNPDEIYR